MSTVALEDDNLDGSGDPGFVKRESNTVGGGAHFPEKEDLKMPS